MTASIGVAIVILSLTSEMCAVATFILSFSSQPNRCVQLKRWHSGLANWVWFEMRWRRLSMISSDYEWWKFEFCCPYLHSRNLARRRCSAHPLCAMFAASNLSSDTIFKNVSPVNCLWNSPSDFVCQHGLAGVSSQTTQYLGCLVSHRQRKEKQHEN